MHTTTSGIVLKKTPYTGSSAVVVVYTRKYGQIPFMVRGIGRKGTRAAMVEPLTRIDISFRRKAKTQIQTAYQIDLKKGNHFHLHPAKSAVSIFLAEVLYKTLREESADEELYDFIENALAAFDSDTFSVNFHLVFLIALTRYFGFFPSGKWTENTPYFDLINGHFTAQKNASLHMFDSPQSQIFSEMAAPGFDELSRQIANEQRRNLLSGIIEYYQIHLEGMGAVKSLPILMEVFS